MIDSAPCPLAFSQERLWFLQMLDPRDRSYQFQSTLQFDGILDVDALERALGTIVARHAIFRTTFHASGGIPTAHVAPQLTVVLERVDIASEADPAAALQRSIAAALADPFDLAQLPLVRWTLVRVSAERHVLVHVEHHIIHDGWSFYLVLSELAALYRAYAHGSVLELEPAPAFADFARAQRSAADSPAAGEGLAYWKRTLSGAPALLAFPTDRPRPPVQTHAGDAIVYELPGEIRSGLEQLSRAHGATVFMTVFAAFAELLARYSGDTDICIGTGVAGRDTPELERLVGMLVNSVVLRVDLGGDPTFLELLERVRRTAIDAYAHAGIALERVVEAVAPPRDPSFNPLFTTMFSFHDSPEPTLDFGALRVTLDQTIDNASAKLDLNVVAIPHRAGITLKWEFNRDLFDRATMQRMVEHFHVLLAAIIDEPERRVSRFALAATHEQAQLAQFAHNVVAYERNAGIVARFNAVAAQAPQATALIAADGVRVSYAELDLRANRLAQSLQRRAGTPGTRVGLLLERSVDAIVAMLAVLKAGGVYVPLTTRFPRERVAWIIADAGIALTITDGTAHDLLPAQAAVLRIDDRSDEIADDSSEPNVDLAVEPASADALAYVMYTSGSTGKPKGVEVTGRGIARLVAAGTPIEIERRDIVANYASYAFDASTYEVWGALLNGAALAILPAGMLSLAELAAALERFGVSVAFLTTPLFHQMVETQLDALAALRLLVVGGDVLAPGHARRFVERGGSARLVNGYGPTENTTFTTLHEVTLASCVGASIPLGRPIANSSVYVLDAHRKPTAIDVPGEICSGGDGVARGYCGRPELTAERFVADPFAAHAGGRLYRTGDRGRWRGDGTLEFLGRADDQVKIRGFRVELGAVTAALAAHPAVGEAAVSVATSGAGENMLVAFVVPAPGVALDPAQLRADLAAELPDYEIPSRVSVLERLPAGVGGKIDRARLAEVLAEPGPAHPATPALSRQPTAALCGPVEERLGELWMRLLGLSAVTRGDDFFALGGHSLLAMRLLARINAAFEVELPLRDLFEHRTIAGLAEAIARAPAAQAAPRMSRAASAAPVAPDLGDLTAITDAELDALIARFSESG